MAIFNRFHYFIHCWNYSITNSIINILFHQKTPKLYFIKKLHNNNILALTHLLQTKHFQNFYLKIEPIDTICL